MRLLVIGAHGKVGQHLVKFAVEQGIDTVAMVRRKEQETTMKKKGANVVLADLEKDFIHAFNDCNVVVFTAGSGSSTGPDKTITVDQQGAIRSIQLAKTQKLNHFVMISAQGARNPEAATRIQHYFKAKKIADDYLIESDVPYTILRPGRLNDDEFNGKISIHRHFDHKGTTSRANLAMTALLTINHPNCLNQIIEVFDGTTTIQEAVTNF